jgi:hypothetical protein
MSSKGIFRVRKSFVVTGKELPWESDGNKKEARERNSGKAENLGRKVREEK